MTAAEIAAMRAARTYIEAHRDELLDGYCIKAPDGTPDRASMDADERAQVENAEAVMAEIDAVLRPPQQQLMEALAHFLLMSRGNYATPEAMAQALVKRLDYEGFCVRQKDGLP